MLGNGGEEGRGGNGKGRGGKVVVGGDVMVDEGGANRKWNYRRVVYG